MPRRVSRVLALIPLLAACGDPTSGSTFSTSALFSSDSTAPAVGTATSGLRIRRPSSLYLAPGATLNLETTTAASGGRRLVSSIAWTSSNPAVLFVNPATGSIAAVTTGSSTVRATSSAGSDSLHLYVIAADALTLAPALPSLAVAATVQLTAGTDVPLQWTSADTTVAVVSASGLVTARAAGTSLVRAANPVGGAGTTTVTVTAVVPPTGSTPNTPPPPPPPAAAASVTVSLSAATVTVGAAVSATAVVRDSGNNVLTGRTVTWNSATQSVATIAESGAITTLSAGSTVLTASVEGKTGTATLQVNAPGGTNTSLTGGVTAQMQTQLASGRCWDAGSSTRVTLATCQGTPSGYQLAVLQSSGQLLLGGSCLVPWGLTGADGEPLTAYGAGCSSPLAKFRFTAADEIRSSNDKCLQPAGSGAAGEQIVLMPCTGVQAQKWRNTGGTTTPPVTPPVTPPTTPQTPPPSAGPVPVASVSVTLGSSSLLVGGTTSATAVSKDANNSTLTDRTVAFSSSNTTVATVSATGGVSALAAGTAVITASVDGKSATATLTVTTPPTTPPAAPPGPPAGPLVVEQPRLWLDELVSAARGATPSRTIAVNTSQAFTAALDTSRYGDEIVLQAGATFTGPFTLRRKSGTGWITIRSSATAAALPAAGQRMRPSYTSNLPRLVSQYAVEPVILTEAGAHHYRLTALEVTSSPGASVAGALVALGSSDRDQSTVSSQPYDLVLDRVYIHGTPSLDFRRCLALNSGATALVDSWLGECHGRGFDSQAIWGSNGTGPYKIVNNMLEGAGENVMFGGSDPKIPNMLPSDIEFRRNHVYKPLSWKGVWSVKNSFELKIGRRVLVEGNVFENNWADAQIGFAIVLKSTNQENSAPWSQTSDVTFQYNIIRNSTYGLSMAANPESAPAQPTTRMRIAHNSFEGLSANGRVLQSSGIQGLSIENNAGFGGFNGFILHDGPHANFTAINNIFGSGSNFVASADGRGIGTEGLDAHAGPNWVFRRNVIVGARSNAYPSDNFYPASVGLVGFLNSSINFALGGSSPYLSAGTDGRAVGPNYTALAAAIAGVIVSP